MISRKRKFRRIAKWAGAAICALVLAAWGISAVRPSTHSWGRAVFCLEHGRFQFLEFEELYYDAPRDKWVWRVNSSSRYFEVPLWLPLVIITPLTGLMFWLDRRRIPPGHCRHCGYDLTGNLSGTCPECGRAVQSSGREDSGVGI